jgi:hypothetical protein
MRGSDKRSGELFSHVDLGKRVRWDHPLRAIRTLTEAALQDLSSDFAALYSAMGRRQLLRAMLLQAFYSIRSERLEYDLLFKWFVGSASMTRCGITRPFRRAAIGCWVGRSRPSS